MEIAARPIRRMLASVLVLASLGSVACSSGKSPTKAASTAFTQTAEDGRFKAEFPSIPERTETPVAVAGIDLVIVSYATETSEDSVIVGYTDYPAGMKSEGVLQAAAEGSAQNVSGTIVSSADTTYVGQPAKDVVVKTSQATLNERLFLVDNRLYTIIGVAASGRPASYDRLLETFSLL